MLTRYGIIDNYEKIRLTHNNRVGNRIFTEYLYLYKDMGDGKWAFPRHYKNIKKSKVKNNKIETSVTFTLSFNQMLIVDEIYKIYRSQYPNCGVNCILDTGHGKTFVAFGLIKKLARKTAYIVHNTNGLENVFDKVKQYFSCSVGKQREDADIVIMTIHTALKRDLKEFTFIIFDEVTKYLTQIRLQIFFGATSFFVLGLTASPEDSKWWEAAELFIGPKLECCEIEGFLENEVHFEGNVRRIDYKNTTEIVKNDMGWKSVINMIKLYVDDDVRNDIIVNEVNSMIANGHNVLLFAQINDMLFNLYFLLEHHDPVILIGGATKAVREAANNAKLIMTNYAYGSHQLTYPHLTGLVLASPMKSNTKQITGRILRKDGDNSVRLIVDIVDAHFKGQFCIRKKIYNERGFNILKK